jgi:hypothetical protein
MGSTVSSGQQDQLHFYATFAFIAVGTTAGLAVAAGARATWRTVSAACLAREARWFPRPASRAYLPSPVDKDRVSFRRQAASRYDRTPLERIVALDRRYCRTSVEGIIEYYRLGSIFPCRSKGGLPQLA